MQRLKDVAGYLNRHGIEISRSACGLSKSARRTHCFGWSHDENINLIVAGAYGHSRLGEWVFGGVTRGLLEESPVCCLFSH